MPIIRLDEELRVGTDSSGKVRYIERSGIMAYYIDWSFNPDSSMSERLFIIKRNRHLDENNHDVFDGTQKEDFVKALSERYPEDFTWLMFHPEIWSGRYDE